MSTLHDEGTPRSVIFGLLLVSISTFAALGVILLSLVPMVKQWFARDVTLTIEAKTQSVMWRALPTDEEPYVLALPPGKVMQQQVDDNFNVAMVGVPLTLPAVEAMGDVEFRMVSRGPCGLDLNVRSLAENKPLKVFDSGAERGDLAASEVAFVLHEPGEAEAPCPAARYDFFLHRAYALEVGEGIGAAEIPEKYVASAATVLEGEVAAHNRAWLFDTRYDLGANAINPGDFVRLVPESSRGDAYKLAVSGAVSYAPAEGDLDVLAYASSAQAEVEHFGGNYVFKSTAWQTIASQPVVQFFFSALAAMLGIAGFVMGIKKWQRGNTMSQLEDR